MNFPTTRPPSIDALLRRPLALDLLARYPRAAVVEALRGAVAGTRAGARDGAPMPEPDGILARAAAALADRALGSLRPAINATGVVLNTGLGRAVLAQAAQQAVARIAAGHSTLEVDRASGERGSRQSHVEGLLVRLTGSEAALVVNNNAAAVFLALSALSAGREVIVSRGQLVEIGGSFRIPDILRSSGARLVEVGTTNRTRLSDYESAISADTSLLLLVHPSNYRIIGFTESVPGSELTELARRHNRARTEVEGPLVVMEDLGSGALFDLRSRGLGDEPVVQESVSAGVDVVTFSGDKLLGGPQAGILVGRAALLERIRRHPLARAVRCDKLTLAALEATLRLYEDGVAEQEVPTLRALLRPLADVRREAQWIATQAAPEYDARMEESSSQVGGGALPAAELPTVLVSLCPPDGSADGLAHALRGGATPVFTRIGGGRVLMDPRTLLQGEAEVVAAVLRVASGSHDLQGFSKKDSGA